MQARLVIFKRKKNVSSLEMWVLQKQAYLLLSKENKLCLLYTKNMQTRLVIFERKKNVTSLPTILTDLTE